MAPRHRHHEPLAAQRPQHHPRLVDGGPQQRDVQGAREHPLHQVGHQDLAAEGDVDPGQVLVQAAGQARQQRVGGRADAADDEPAGEPGGDPARLQPGVVHRGQELPRHVQALGRAPEVALLGDGDEVAQMPQLHAQ